MKLEIKACAELNRTLPAHACDLPKQWIRNICLNAAPLRAIERVQEIAAQLEPEFLAEPDNLLKAEVFADSAEVAYLGRIWSGIA
jgi:hypothetical protein